MGQGEMGGGGGVVDRRGLMRNNWEEKKTKLTMLIEQLDEKVR